MTDLSRGNGVAVWRQISQALRDDIGAGAYAPGDRMPTEADLARRFAVNRHTVRRAIADLQEQGMLRVEQGRGTFVHEDVIDYRLGPRTRFAETISAQKRAPAGILIRGFEMPADQNVAEALALDVGEPVVVIERLGEADGRPISIGTHYFPKSRFPTMIEEYRSTGSITAALARLGVADYVRASTRVRARRATADEARQLQQPANAPILQTEAVNQDTDGKPIEYGVSRFASDRVQLIIDE